MRRLSWLPLLALLIAAPARATQPPWIAIFIENAMSRPSSGEVQTILNTLEMGGAPVKYFNPNARTWGASGTDDSLWFKQQGCRAVICWIDGGATGVPVTGSCWGTRFQNAAGSARVQDSPLDGLWGMEVHVLVSSSVFTPSTSYDLDLAGSNDRFIPGVLHTAPAGGIVRPAVGVLGTWRYRFIARIKGATDTIIADAPGCACLHTPYGGAGSVVAKAWTDSAIASGFGNPAINTGCAAGDTAVIVWTVKPSTSPGATYYMMFLSRTGQNLSLIWALQSIYSNTTCRPGEIIRIPFVIHDWEPNDETSAPSIAAHAQLVDTIYSYKTPVRIATPGNGAEYSNFYNTASLTPVRRQLNSAANSYWMPFSYSVGAEQWNFIYYTQADTLAARRMFNSTMNTLSNADSFAFPKNRMSVSRLVSGAGVVGGNVQKVLADAGVRIVDTTLPSDRGPNWAGATPDTGWALICQGNGNPLGSTGASGASSALSFVPGAGESRYLWTQYTTGLLHSGSTYTALRGNAGDWEYLGVWYQSLWATTMRRGSLYFHINTVTVSDPYYSWLLGQLFRTVGYFDKVIAWDGGTGGQIQPPRSVYAP